VKNSFSILSEITLDEQPKNNKVHLNGFLIFWRNPF
jgi:hypothetical protein